MTDTGDWFDQARCGGSAEAFVSDHSDRAYAEHLALRYCARCPVVAECRAYAHTHQLIGIWGGELLTTRGRPAHLLHDTQEQP